MFLRIITKQARHKWAVALLISLAITSLVALWVYSSNTGRFANRSMQIVMKNMGHNLLILPEEADPWTVYLASDSQATLADDTTQRMSEALGLSSKYYVSVLQRKVEVAGRELLLTGVEPVSRDDETAEKRNMVLPLGGGEARLGSESARKLGAKCGDSVQILGGEFHVVEILPPKATLDDCRIYVNLASCQKLLGQEGRINYILAFLCLHGGSLDEALKLQEKKLVDAFPGFRQISRMDIVQGRHLARITTQESLYYLIGIVAVATIVVIAVTGLQEVNDRRHETGIMISMGVSHVYIVGLYLVKTLVLAAVSSLAGFILGSLLAVHFTAPFLVVNTIPVTVLWSELPLIMEITCGVAILAEIIPIIRLLMLDPNTILVEQ